MKKRISIAVLAIALAISLPAGLSAQEEKERSLKLPDRRLGLIVNFAGLANSALFSEYNDGIQGGLGMKLWLGEKSAVRALLDIEHVNDDGVKDSWFGLGAAYEYHLLQRRVSPYVGALAGIAAQTGTANDLGIYFGPLLGAEFELVENLALFGEYSLLVSFDEPIFSIGLGLGNAGKLGIIVYLN